MKNSRLTRDFFTTPRLMDMVMRVDAASNEYNDVPFNRAGAVIMYPDQFSLSDIRRQMMSTVRPGFFRRILWWMATLFGPREVRAIFDDPEVKMHCRQVIGIIDAMTPCERSNPKLIDRERMFRIAHGAGVPLSEVMSLLGMYEAVKFAPRNWRYKRGKPNDDHPI
jgi:signal recognition particle GTPase